MPIRESSSSSPTGRTTLELVQFLDDGDGNHQVVFLEMPDGVVVVEDDVGVQDEDLRFALRPPHSFSSSVLCHIF